VRCVWGRNHDQGGFVETAMAAISVVVVISFALMAIAVMAQGPWDTADATFYGDMSGNATMGEFSCLSSPFFYCSFVVRERADGVCFGAGGTCGYDNLFEHGYGLANGALSTVLFNDGEMCGACFELKCVAGPDRCKEGSSTILTATSFCPPAPVSLCNPPQKHFDLSMRMYMNIAKANNSGSIPVQFRRVPCVREGGIGFEFRGNPFWISVLVYNVAGSGDVQKLSVRGSNTTWVPMTRSWGQRWQLSFKPEMVGQSLSFQVTTGDGKMVESVDVAPADWQFGQRYTGGQF
ncbi:hypothetical protein BHM03_00035416, partial [Ensete ventricosum]